jgi:hypothetical protein
VAAVWAITAATVFSETDCRIGAESLTRLGLPVWPMPATCALEAVLAGVLLVTGRRRALVPFQVAMVASFTVILGAAEPRLLVGPFGFPSENVPLCAAAVLDWRLHRDGWTPGNERLLAWAMAIAWFTEGLFPKMLFQQTVEPQMADRLTGGAVPAAALIGALGLVQVVSFGAALALRGRALRVVLGLEVHARVGLPVFAGTLEPWPWVHPFGPSSKNLPLLAGTWLRWTRCFGRTSKKSVLDSFNSASPK